MNKQKIVLISILSLSFLVVAGSAIAAMTFDTNAITGDGALNINPTGQPVTVNGDLTVTGTCTGCGGGGGTPGGSDTQIQFNNNGSLGGSANLIFDPAWTPANLTPQFQIGPADSALDPAIQGYLLPARVFVTSDATGGNGGFGSGFGVEVSATDETQIVGLSAAIAGHVVDYGYNTALFGAAISTDTTGMAGQTIGATVLPGVIAGGHANEVAGFYVQNTGVGAGGVINTFTGFYSQALDGTATNAYPFWADEQGVFRIKADNTFNTVYQAIPALYNPQFTKYTPGASNYERIVMGQWESNVAVITTEKGGTGTLRNLRIGDGNVLTTLGTVTTVGSLPACNSAAEGARRAVSDANSTTFNATAAGGGSNHMGVYCNGTNWVIGN